MKKPHQSRPRNAGRSASRLPGAMVCLALGITVAAALALPGQHGSWASSLTDHDSGTGHGPGMLQYQKQLENDIAQSIKMMNPIKEAKVLLALPEPPGAGESSSRPSASVIVDIDSMQTLSPGQIETIIQLVAASVPRLERDRITLSDQRGQPMSSEESGPVSMEHAGGSVDRSRLEEILAKRAVNILSPFVGIEGVRVEVSADWEPDGAGHSTGSNELNANASEAASLLPSQSLLSQEAAKSLSPSESFTEKARLAGDSGNSDRLRSFRDTAGHKGRSRHFHDRPTEPANSIQPFPRRLSVAVVLDEKHEIEQDGTVKSSPYSQEELDRFNGLVKHAVGFDAARGDQIMVSNAAFKKTDAEVSVPALPSEGQVRLSLISRQSAAGLALVLLCIFIVKPLFRNWFGPGGESRHHKTDTESKEQPQGHGPALGLNEIPTHHAEPLRRAVNELPDDIADILFFEPSDGFRYRLDYVHKIGDAAPQLVAEVVMRWLKNADNVSGQWHRAALLMLSLGMERAAGVVRHLPPRDVQNIGSAMAGVKDMSNTALERTLEEFITAVKKRIIWVGDKNEYIGTLLTTALGEQIAKSVLQTIVPASQVKGIERLKGMDSQSVAELFGKEHPQVIAVLVSLLDCQQAAEVMLSMPESLRSDIAARIASLEGVQPSALRELGHVIDQLLPLHADENLASLGGVDFAARVLNRMDGKSGDRILEQIAEQSQELARNIQEKMLVFDDLIHLDAKEIKTLLREISTGQLLLALNDAGEALKEKIFQNMSRRAAEMMREDLAMMGETNPYEIELARKDILSTVKKLADAGELKLKIEEV